MKKNFFLFAMLASITASATVKITPLSANYSTQEVTFKVEWQNASVPYNNRVWVWIDFCPVIGTIPATSFSTATVSNPAKTGGNGTIIGGTSRGFFIEYANATNAGTTVTATLSNAPVGKFNWCAYGSDFLPNVTASGGTYTFRGTPPFTLKDANGNITQTIPGKTLPATSLTTTPAPVTLTDKTGYPGIFCIYTGNDLYIDATHLCQQRTSGAQNWEAWIKDTRDNELYRIVLMPDNKWWLAQNMKYAGTGTQPSWCTKDECGRLYQHAQANGSWGGTSGSGSNKQGV